MNIDGHGNAKSAPYGSDAPPSLLSFANLQAWFPLISTRPPEVLPKQQQARRFQVEKQRLRRADIQKLWNTLDALVPGESESPSHAALPFSGKTSSRGRVLQVVRHPGYVAYQFCSSSPTVLKTYG
jgi:hypothetical protein